MPSASRQSAATASSSAKTKGGIVNTNGSIGYGSGFSVSHLGTGSYQLSNLDDDHKESDLLKLAGTKVQVKGVLHGEGAPGVALGDGVEGDHVPVTLPSRR